jgi:hypothetical protein
MDARGKYRSYPSSCQPRRIDWYDGDYPVEELAVIIERKGSEVAWLLRQIVRGMEGSAYMVCGSYQL